MQRIIASLVASAAAAGLAAAPAQAAWPTRTVATGGAAFAFDVEALPGGGVATLLERSRGGGVRGLELRVGSRATELARAPHTFGPADVGSDVRGRLTVAYAAIPGRSGGRRLYATSAGRTQQLSTGSSSVSAVDLDVAPDGGAAVAWWAGGRVFAARRAPGATAFGRAEPIGSPQGRFGFPHVEALDGGGAVLLTGGAVTRSGGAGQPFATPVEIAPGRNADGETLAVDDRGQAVAAVKVTRKLGARGPYRREVVAATWPAGAPAPRAPVTLSDEDQQAGIPVAVTSDGDVTVAFQQAPASRSRAVLHAVRFREDGSHAGSARRGAATPMTYLTATPSAGGVRVYTRVDGAIRTTRFDAAGRPGPWAVVTADRTSTVLAAEAAGRPVAVWTVQAGRGSAAFRVRIARP